MQDIVVTGAVTEIDAPGVEDTAEGSPVPDGNFVVGIAVVLVFGVPGTATQYHVPSYAGCQDRMPPR